MHQTESLILEVFKQDDSLKMGMFSQSQTAPTLRHYSQVGVSFSELNHLSQEMAGILNRRAGEQPSKLQQLKSLQKTGRLFWDHLLSRPVKIRLKESQPCALTLSLDEELIYIPWELIFDGSDFLSLKFSLGRLVRGKGDSALPRYRDLADSLKMLILANPSGDLKSAYLEGLNIKDQFSHKTKKVQVDFKSTDIDKHYVKKNICDYDIVHFAGHFEFNKSEVKDNGWVLSDGILKVDEILKMGQSCSLPALVFSNACHSAQVNLLLIDSRYQQANYGMASAFLFAGVRHYIGSIHKIEDDASLVFAREFYTKLISGISVGESLRLSRLKLIQKYGVSSLHWVNYLLYGDPDFVFFRFPRGKGVKRKPLIVYKKIAVKISLALVFVSLGVFLFFGLPRINPTKMYLYFSAVSKYRQGNNQAATILGRQAIGKDHDFLAVYPVVAAAYQNLGDKSKARQYYLEYMLRSEKLNNRKHLLQAYLKLGWFYQLDGRYVKALELYEKSLKLSRQAKDRHNEAQALRKLAVWHIDRNNYDLALDLLTKSAAINLEFSGNFDNLKNLACDYFDIGLVFANKEDYEAAKDFYGRSLKIFQRLKLNNELSDCYFNLGEIHLYQKQYQKALDYYFKGLELDRKYNNKNNLACGFNMIGELYLEIDDLPKAESYFKQAASLAEQIDSRLELADADYNLGLLYKIRRKKNLAREYWRKAQETYRSVDMQRYLEIRKELLELDVI